MEQQLFGKNKDHELILRRVRDLPSLPDVVSRIIELLGRSDIPAAEVARLISYDPGLTSKVLRMVNSAAYGFQRQISSVQHAIMILGFSSVRGVVLSASIFKMFQSKGPTGLDPANFWRHSIATAIASRLMADKWRIPYAEDAFSAGMLHDIGKLVLDYYFTPHYAKVLLEARQKRVIHHGTPFLHLERRILGADHADLGAQLGVRWKLPATFIEVIRYHHDPVKAKDATHLVHVVALANSFAHLIQWNYGVFAIEFIPADVLAFFGYEKGGEAPFEELFKQLADEMDGVEDLLKTLQR